jgi:Ala-tRNA(Pro) deacylase
MAMATTIKEFLAVRGTKYELVPHTHTHSSQYSAEAAHVPGDKVAKSVVLRDADDGYLMAVLPATCQVELSILARQLNRRLALVDEAELADLFRDCELGAVPAVGAAYGIRTVVDVRLLEQPDIFFEAGDHQELVHLSGGEFRDLLQNFERVDFSRHL